MIIQEVFSNFHFYLIVCLRRKGFETFQERDGDDFIGNGNKMFPSPCIYLTICKSQSIETRLFFIPSQYIITSKIALLMPSCIEKLEFFFFWPDIMNQMGITISHPKHEGTRISDSTTNFSRYYNFSLYNQLF